MLATQSKDPLDELLHEEEVLEKLLDRVADLPTETPSGPEGGWEELREGLDLLARYWAIHVQRFDRDFQPRARLAARPVPRAGCFEHLDRITLERPDQEDPLEALLGEVGRAGERTPEMRRKVATDLKDLVDRLREAIRHEVEYPLSCLFTALSEDASVEVMERFASTAADLAEIEERIRDYVDRPPGSLSSKTLHLTCAHPGCPAETDAKVRSLPGRPLSVEPPPGWQAVSVAERAQREVDNPLRVRGCCPRHASERSRDEFAARAISVWADEGGWAAPPEMEGSGSEETDCCNLDG